MNLLSTILKIKFKDTENYLLLTADADKETIKRIGINYEKRKNEHLKGTLLLGQIPHHGAKANHSKSFWQKINRINGCFAVFSVGKNHYGHPAQSVRDDLIDLNYQLCYTMNLFIPDDIHNEIIPSLNVFSVPDVEGEDKVFYFDNSNNIIEITT
jgi:beta-lactamase superfamily II metal-dependent hydrolase